MPVPPRFGFLGGAIGDSFFKNVALLLHGDGANAAQNNTFLDTSANAIALTRNGNATQGAMSPYSSRWSNYFDGASSYLSVPDNAAFAFGSGDFTIECWFLSTVALPAEVGLVAKWNAATVAGTNSWLLFVNSGTPTFSVSTDGTNSVAAGAAASTMLPGVWNHIAVVRSGNTVTLYLNGVGGTPVTYSSSIFVSTQPVLIGARGTTPGYPTGFISNVRVVKGTAVYTANFTPPGGPLSAITNTSLLTCQANRFIDGSTNAFTVTLNGTAAVSPFTPFIGSPYSALSSGGSGYFDGTGDYITTASNAGIGLASGDFTIECWFYKTSNATLGLMGTSTGAGGWQLQSFSDNTIRWYKGGNTLAITSSGPTGGCYANCWNHIAAVRQSGTVTLYINGVNVGSAADATNYTDTTAAVGAQVTPAGFVMIGHLTDARLVKGTAVYTGAFTPPTSPLTAIANTQLLCGFTNGGVIDNARQVDLETVGNAQISTTQSKFGGSSISIPSAADRLVSRAMPPLTFGPDDFTLEGWVYLTAAPASFATFITNMNTDVDGTAGRYALITRSTGVLEFVGSGATVVAAGSIGLNAWHHVACTRASGNIRLFIDGTQVGSTTAFSTSMPANALAVGSLPNGSGGAAAYYLDDVRVTAGVARYTANFTPPTGAFPNQ